MERWEAQWKPVSELPPEMEGMEASDDVLGCYLSGQMSAVFYDYVLEEWTDCETNQSLAGKQLMLWTVLPSIPPEVLRARVLYDPRDYEDLSR